MSSVREFGGGFIDVVHWSHVYNTTCSPQKMVSLVWPAKANFFKKIYFGFARFANPDQDTS